MESVNIPSHPTKSTPPAVTGLWKISSIEDPEHPGCLGGRMRPSCEALMDVAVAGAMEVDTSVKASAIHAQLRQQVASYMPRATRSGAASPTPGVEPPSPPPSPTAFNRVLYPHLGP